MKCFLVGLISLLWISVGSVAGSPAPELVDFFSFEQDFEGWIPESINTVASITRSQDRAKDGETSLKLSLQGPEVPTGVAWIQRPFGLTPKQTYQAQVKYWFATADTPATVTGPSRAVAGALANPPATVADLLPLFQDSFFNDSGTSAFRWLRKQYEFTAQTDDAGMLSVIIGVFGGGGNHTYYLDSVRVKFIRRLAGAAEPVISSAARVGKKVTIEGSAFGPSPRVLINNVDRTDFVTVSSPDLIKVKGTLTDLGLIFENNTIRVVDDTTAAASEPFHLMVTN